MNDLFSGLETYASPPPSKDMAAVAAEQMKIQGDLLALSNAPDSEPAESLVARVAKQRKLSAKQQALSQQAEVRSTVASKKLREVVDSGLVPMAKRRVTMSERMTKSIQSLTLGQKRLVSMAGAALYGTSEAAPVVTINAKDYSSIFGIPLRQAYQELKDACGWDSETKEFQPDQGLLRAYIQLKDGPKIAPPVGRSKTTDSKNTDPTYTFIRWVQMARYHVGTGTVQIQFAQELVPHLRNVTERFGAYLLQNTKGLRNVYAWRLADLLSPQSLGKFSISFRELRTVLEATSERHQEFKHFNAEVLKPAIAALNVRFSVEGSDPLDRTLNLQLQAKKVLDHNHTVTHIEFTFNHRRLLSSASPP